MIVPASPTLDPRTAEHFVEEFLKRRPGYLERWDPPQQGLGAALIRVHARYLEAILERLNQAPENNKLAFLEMLGIEIIPAQAARAPVVFKLADDAPAARLPAGAQVAAPPPPDATDQVVFETERAVGLSPAQLQEVFSLWPGRDQYIDHSEAALAGESIRPFRKSDLKDTPHIIYIAHDTLLALSARVQLDVEFELSHPGTESLDIIWEYWDGKLWRGFKKQHPECAELGEFRLDGTAGFTRNGKFRLETECAEAAKTTVNDVEAHWIRGVLAEPLPTDPNQILPEVTQVRLTNVIEHPLSVHLVDVETTPGPDGDDTSAVFIKVQVVNQEDQVITDVDVALLDDKGRAQEQVEIDPAPKFKLTSSKGGTYTLEVDILRTNLTHKVTFQSPFSSGNLLTVKMKVRIGGLLPDSAFADAEAVDLTKPFYPFGQSPQPGSTFYFACQEAFSKPGARLTIHARRTKTPQDDSEVVILPTPSDPPAKLEHAVSWEYWNGRAWISLEHFSYPTGDSTADTEGNPRDFTGSGQFDLVIPEDIAPVKVNDEEALWMRVRLAEGGFGYRATVTWVGDTVTNEFTYVIPQPPALGDFRLSYTWNDGPVHAEHVVTYNDFQYTDRTSEAKWPGTTFQPFSRMADLTPALYLGYDKDFPVDRLTHYFDIVEKTDRATAPALVWEYWNGFNWKALRVEDETQELRYSGMISLIGPEDAEPRARFAKNLYWLRTRLKEDGPPLEPQIDGIYTNAVWCSQRQTIVNESAGTSTGQPNQAFSLRRIPVLDGEHIEIRELSGARANVEWRIIARELLNRDMEAIRSLEHRLGEEGTHLDVQEGDLRLRRDRNKRVTEVWVHWYPRPHLLVSGATDRHYVLDRTRGRLIFGDGEHGKVPPLAAQILAREYRTGGGTAGNVAKDAISQALTGVAGIDTIFNPLPAEGGADAEVPERVSQRGPRTLRHRGRSVALPDLETMAKEASPAVAVVQVHAARDPQGITRPGWVTLVLIPHSNEARPWPTFGLREKVRRHIEEFSPASIVAAQQLYVTGPDYQQVDCEATIVPQDPTAAGDVERAARDALERFFHPLYGGPEGCGWTPGRGVFLSDVATVLERVSGVDYVREMKLLIDSVPQGETVAVPAGRIVAAGAIRITLAF